jgi:hypothetical protein
MDGFVTGAFCIFVTLAFAFFSAIFAIEIVFTARQMLRWWL